MPDFELEDVWALPTPGGADDFPRLERQFASVGKAEDSPMVVRALFALRFWLGRVFGWDKADSRVGARVSSLRHRLPADLRDSSSGADQGAAFSLIYRTDNEWASEVSNQTVHAVMHIGWVRDDSGDGYHAQMAVLVRPNGWLGRAYMLAIKPFRHAIVYPQMLRSIGRKWSAGSACVAQSGRAGSPGTKSSR